ncbi:hypothetical protein A3G56_02825 [Candidatus Falkowbacteria bacterium RIFCSPLOWO2_12_FULL_45_10]|uniref:DUF8173 domain-containing protein n=1 Tax=Candidatus Falkowbacteria bacterium RIFCSPLOWO2_12_FULL_45_10 TaxID=1797990 RepID=A0A1F5RXZ4_9BACT|nr:MAG: hypothetical protein A3G56_02825 [Candidatus Falkowbacteria bacterium RIFCSPLOWO2_12_FULL_45_10]
MNRKRIFLILGAAVAIVMVPAAAFAFEVKKGNNIYVGENETVAGNLYAAGVNVIIDGQITGDLFCAGQSVTINGEVGGDVFCAGSAIAINGKVGGSIRAAASELSISGQIERSALAVASNINLQDGGQIGWSFLGAAANFTAYGPIGRDLQFAGASLVVNNEVGGNVRFYGEMKGQKKNNAPTLTLLPKAVVNGSLTYSETITTDVKDGAQIKGDTIKQAPKVKEFTKFERKKQFIFWPFIVFSLVSTVILGLVLVRLNGDAVKTVTDNILERPWATLGWGLMLLILTPIVIILLLITLVGIPLAILVGLLFGIYLILAKVTFGIALGRLINDKASWKLSLYWATTIGIVITDLIIFIPIIGWIIGFFALLWSFGALMIASKKLIK